MCVRKYASNHEETTGGYIHGNVKNYISVTIYNGHTVINYLHHLIGNLFDNLLQANALNELRCLIVFYMG